MSSRRAHVAPPVAARGHPEKVVGRLEFAFRAGAGEPDGGQAPDPHPDEFPHLNHVRNLGIHCQYYHAGTIPGPHMANADHSCWRRHPNAPEKTDRTAAVRRRWFVVKRDGEKSPKEIDLSECDALGRALPGVAVGRGIYEEGPAGLRVALPFGPDHAADFRPRTFESKLLTP